MDETVRQAVRDRAGRRCEYCRFPEAVIRIPFEVEHVLPRQHGGPDALGNLAWACLHCNRHKGPNVAGVDRVGRRRVVVKLFHPRVHRWGYHFAVTGSRIVGRTAIGRVTVAVLAMNAPQAVALRAELIAEGLYPPAG